MDEYRQPQSRKELLIAQLLAIANFFFQIFFWNSPYFNGGLGFSPWVGDSFVKNYEAFSWGTAIWIVIISLVASVIILFYFYKIIRKVNGHSRKFTRILLVFIIATLINAAVVLFIGIVS